MTISTNYLDFRTAPFDGGSGDIEVVAAVAGLKINVHAYIITQAAANSLFRWEDGAAGTALTGSIETSIDSPIVIPFSEIPWFSTSVNTALSLESTTGGSAGHIIYSLTEN